MTSLFEIGGKVVLLGGGAVVLPGGLGNNILSVIFPQNIPLGVGIPALFTLSATGPAASITLPFVWSTAITGATGNAAIDTSGDFTWTPASSGNFTMTYEVFDSANPPNYGTGAITWVVS